MVCDLFDLAECQTLWCGFQALIGPATIDVLVLNAVHHPALQPILEQGCERLWQDFEANVEKILQAAGTHNPEGE